MREGQEKQTFGRLVAAAYRLAGVVSLPLTRQVRGNKSAGFCSVAQKGCLSSRRAALELLAVTAVCPSLPVPGWVYHGRCPPHPPTEHPSTESIYCMLNAAPFFGAPSNPRIPVSSISLASPAPLLDMFSIETILNPAPSGREASQPFQSSPSPSSAAALFSPLPVMDCPPIPPMRTSSGREPAGPAKTKLRGAIHYQPFEVVSEQALYEIHRFRVTPFGQIKQTCSHIPYNSGKKDFYEKTGRESFEGGHAGGCFGRVFANGV